MCIQAYMWTNPISILACIKSSQLLASQSMALQIAVGQCRQPKTRSFCDVNKAEFLSKLSIPPDEGVSFPETDINRPTKSGGWWVQWAHTRKHVADTHWFSGRYIYINKYILYRISSLPIFPIRSPWWPAWSAVSQHDPHGPAVP